MKITIVYDRLALDDKLRSGWGFSCLVGDKVLFDTADSASNLLENLKFLKIDPGQIEKMVISHEHWDHTGGRDKLRKINPRIKLCHSSDFMELGQGIYLTGEITGEYATGLIKEISLAIKTDKGVSLVTGCAHPGIVNIICRVKKYFKVRGLYTVLGGFHLYNESLKQVEYVISKFIEEEVEKAAPAHCTGEEAVAIFKKKYQNNFIPVAAGKIIEL